MRIPFASIVRCVITAALPRSAWRFDGGEGDAKARPSQGRTAAVAGDHFGLRTSCLPLRNASHGPPCPLRGVRKAAAPVFVRKTGRIPYASQETSHKGFVATKMFAAALDKQISWAGRRAPRDCNPDRTGRHAGGRRGARIIFLRGPPWDASPRPSLFTKAPGRPTARRSSPRSPARSASIDVSACSTSARGRGFSRSDRADCGEIVGVDPEPAMIEAAREAAERSGVALRLIEGRFEDFAREPRRVRRGHDRPGAPLARSRARPQDAGTGRRAAGQNSRLPRAQRQKRPQPLARSPRRRGAAGAASCWTAATVPFSLAVDLPRARRFASKRPSISPSTASPTGCCRC